MLCTREFALQIMKSGQNPREVLVPDVNETPEEKRCREELIYAIEHKEKTFFHYFHVDSETSHVQDQLKKLGYKVLSCGSSTGNAVLYSDSKELKEN